MSKSRIEDLKAARTRTLKTLKSIVDPPAAENRKLTRDEQGRYEAAIAEIDRIDGTLSELNEHEQRTQAAEKAMAPFKGRTATPARGDGEPLRGESWLPSMREFRELEQRAVGSTGTFLFQAQAEYWYDRLRNASVVLASGPLNVPVEATSLRIPTVSASVTVSTLAENTAITPSDPTFSSATLTPRKVAALTLASNEALADSQPALREVVAADMVRQTATVLDDQFLNGNGTAPNMRGFRNFTGATVLSTLGANGGTPTLDTYATQLATAEGLNVNSDRLAWYMSPRSWGTIRSLKDTQNRFQLNPTPIDDAPKSLFGVPVYITSNLPNNLTVGTSVDTSTAILADLDQVVVGRSADVQVAYSADYAFNADQTAIRVIGRFDIQPVNAAATVVLPGIRP